ncbi:MAG: hypothetical protein EA401_09070 [Planctomycetota bacterium]|nr:MAG: hypothetical protein EA401_09070 [Planctomycetota bacterium]
MADQLDHCSVWSIASKAEHPWEHAYGLPAGCAAAASWLSRIPGEDPLVLCTVPQPASVHLLLAALWTRRSLVLLSPHDPPASHRARLQQLPIQPRHWLGSTPPQPNMQHHPLPPQWPAVDSIDCVEDGQHIAWIIFGSGSSGRHRAIALRQRPLLAAAHCQAQHLGLSPGMRWLCCLPLHHVGGCMAVLRSLLAGADLSLHSAFAAQQVIASLHDCHGISVVPTMAQRLLEHTPHWDHAPIILLGGAACSSALRQSLIATGCIPLRCWGATETAAMATCERYTDDPGPSACGPALPGYELAIGSGQQLLVRGPGIADTAYQHGRTISLRDALGWLHTGDAADIDSTGILHLRGRLDQAFTSGGETVFSEDIEQILFTHPDIGDCCVVAIPDPQWGQVAAAWITPRHTDTPLHIEHVESWCRRQLSPAQRPRHWHLTDTIPQLANGKNDRHAVRQFFTSNTV